MIIDKILDAVKKRDIYCTAVVVAAGNSTRFGYDKMLAKIGNIPVICHSLLALQNNSYVNEIIVVTQPEKIETIAELCNNYRIDKAVKIVCGGANRIESALSGASEVNPKTNLIAIHDGARPMVSDEVISRVIQCANTYQSAIPAIPVKDTLKVVDGNQIKSTPDRKKLYAAQTPQVFVPEILKGALTNALHKGLFTYDDSSAVEILGENVHICEGDEQNLKITIPFDLTIAETVYQNRRRKIFEDNGIQM